MAEQLSGIIPPRTTPFDRDGGRGRAQAPHRRLLPLWPAMAGTNPSAQRLQSLVPARAAAE